MLRAGPDRGTPLGSRFRVEPALPIDTDDDGWPMRYEESTAAFKRFTNSARLDDTRFRYMQDPFFKGFVRLLSSMLGESITPPQYFDLCEDLLSMAALNPRRSRKDIESLVTRLVVYMQGCPPVTPKLFSDRFTNATITLFAKRYLQGSTE